LCPYTTLFRSRIPVTIAARTAPESSSQPLHTRLNHSVPAAILPLSAGYPASTPDRDHSSVPYPVADSVARHAVLPPRLTITCSKHLTRHTDACPDWRLDCAKKRSGR